jgi:hypothetical protein
MKQCSRCHVSFCFALNSHDLNLTLVSVHLLLFGGLSGWSSQQYGIILYGAILTVFRNVIGNPATRTYVKRLIFEERDRVVDPKDSKYNKAIVSKDYVHSRAVMY